MKSPAGAGPLNRLDLLHSFVRVAELSSFTQAAEQLGLPKASVSSAVQQLEASLGARLLHRTTRKVQLTQDGELFYERCKDLLADLDELQTLFQQGPALRGRLRVDMSTGIARHMVLPALPAFLQAHPQLSLELSCTDRRVDLVREGFDCVLRVGSRLDPGLVARPLGQFRMANCASPAYIERHGQPLSLGELATHQLVHFVPTLGARPDGFETLDAAGRVLQVAVAGAVTVNSAEAYQGACLAGLGIIQAPRAGIASLLADGQLVEVLPQHPAPAMPVTLLYANRRQQPRRVQAFMQWLADLMAPHLEPLQPRPAPPVATA